MEEEAGNSVFIGEPKLRTQMHYYAVRKTVPYLETLLGI